MMKRIQSPLPILSLLFVLVASPGSSIFAAEPGVEIGSLLEAYARDRPVPDATVQALVKIMAESPADPGVPRAFGWLLRHGGVSPGSDYDMDQPFFARIEQYHRDNDELAGALTACIGHREDETIAFLERLGDHSESALVSGAALLALASSFEHDSKAVDRYDAALQKLITKHPDLKLGGSDLTGYARQKLFASQNLRIGMVAPEVEGEDAAGEQFKLSDYRGKVVFFNFWGDW